MVPKEGRAGMAFLFPLGNRALGSSRIYEIFAVVFHWLVPDASALLHGRYLVLRRGKKQFAGIEHAA